MTAKSLLVRLLRRLTIGLLLSAIVGGFLGCLGSGASDLPTDAPRRIVLIVVDTLRADHLGAYGGAVATPHLDALARRGVVFERAYSHAPITGPSHVSMFTGLLPVDHRVEGNAQIVAPEVELLAERLREAGYATAGFVSLGVLSRQWGFAQGFDTYGDDFTGQWFRPAEEIRRRAVDWLSRSGSGPAFLWVHFSDPHEPYAPPSRSYPRFDVILDGEVLATVEANGYNWTVPARLSPGDHRIAFRPRDLPAGTRVVFRSIHETGGKARLALGHGWAEEEGSAPIWWNLSTLPAELRAHNPLGRTLATQLRFFCHEDLTIEDVRRLYVKEIEYVDREIGELVAALEQHEGWEDALIFVTSDHGEGLGDHGLVGHIEQLYDTLVHVPLIVVGPGRVEPGRVRHVVRHVDLPATIVDYLGRGERHGRGHSLRRLLEGHDDGRRRPVVSFTGQPTAAHDRRSLVIGSLKYILTLPAGPEELYDLAADPGEVHDLLSGEFQRRGQMRRRLDLLLEPLAGGPDAVQPADLDDEERRQLRALGYLR